MNMNGETLSKVEGEVHAGTREFYGRESVTT
jgi:hypothetical protein